MTFVHKITKKRYEHCGEDYELYKILLSVGYEVAPEDPFTVPYMEAYEMALIDKKNNLLDEVRRINELIGV